MNCFQFKDGGLYHAVKAGVAPRNVVCSGVGKKDGAIVRPVR